MLDLYRDVIKTNRAGIGSPINFVMSPQVKFVVDHLGLVNRCDGEQWGGV